MSHAFMSTEALLAAQRTTLDAMERKEAERARERARAQYDRARTKRSYRPNGHSDVLDLVNALGRAEWGCISAPRWRGHRIILSTIAALMFDAHRGRSARLVTTAAQIAARAGYSERWTRQCLAEMEEVGIIEWERGGIVDARPTPSLIKIVKTVLCDWISDARQRHQERAQKRRAAFEKRLASIRDARKTLPAYHILRMRRLKNARRELLDEVLNFAKETETIVKSQAELTASPLPTGREGKAESPSTDPGHIDERNETMRLGQIKPGCLPDTCKHKPGTPPEMCSWCQFEAKTQRTQDTELIRQSSKPPSKKTGSSKPQPKTVNPALISTLAAMKAQEEALQTSVHQTTLQMQAGKERDTKRRNAYQKYMEDTYPHMTWRERARLCAKDPIAKAILSGERDG